MRLDGGGDDGTDDGDGVDDEPDDARRDGDDDGGDSPPGGKFLFDTPDVFRSRVSNTPKGSRRGYTGTRGGPHLHP